jgi:signal transduction histidine kinase
LPPGFCRQESYIVAVLFSLVTVLYISTYVTSAIAEDLRKRQREVASLKDRCLIDVRALGAANRKLVELDRLRNHFLAIASHDLQAPLSAVQTYLQVILGGFTGEITDEQRDMLKRSSIRIEGLLGLINDILDATRIEAGQIIQEMEEICLADVVEDALENVSSLAEEKGLELSAEIAQGLPAIPGAPYRLAQVITNLSNNAIKFTPAGGKVIIRVRENADHLQVEVMDTGIGIPSDDMPRIFEEFYRGRDVDAEGAGLGLAIARKIVEAHGGEIWAESPYSEGTKGSKFTFTLPKG